MATIRRDRKSSIDLLPSEALPDVTWAIQEIEGGGRHLKDIRIDFNARLAERGLRPVSPSAFNRYALKKREALAELAEVRQVANAVISELGPDDDDAVTRLIAQQLKARIYARLRKREDELDEKGTKDLSQAMQAITTAEQRSSDRTARHAKEVDDKVAKAVSVGVETFAKQKGMSAETAEEMKAKILGVRAS